MESVSPRYQKQLETLAATLVSPERFGVLAVAAVQGVGLPERPDHWPTLPTAA